MINDKGAFVESVYNSYQHKALKLKLNQAFVCFAKRVVDGGKGKLK